MIDDKYVLVFDLDMIPDTDLVAYKQSNGDIIKITGKAGEVGSISEPTSKERWKNMTNISK